MFLLCWKLCLRTRFQVTLLKYSHSLKQVLTTRMSKRETGSATVSLHFIKRALQVPWFLGPTVQGLPGTSSLPCPSTRT